MKVRLPKSSGAGMNNLQQLAKQAQETQAKMEQASSELEAKEYFATSGGEAVKVKINGKLEVQSIELKPEIVDPEEVDMLSDLIIAAINEAIKKANEEKEEVMGQISGQMNLSGLF